MSNVTAQLAQNNIQQAQTLLKTAKYSASLQHYEIAARYFETAQIWEKYLLCLNNRVSIYLFAHQLDMAQKEGEKVLSICQQLLGEVHEQYVFGLNNLAGVRLHKNQYDDALNYYQQSLQISQTLHHPAHISVAQTYSNIANLFRLKGQAQKALDYYQETLSIQQQQLRDHHADLANTYTSMGLVCGEMGNHDLGLKYHFQSLNIRKETLTPQHLSQLHTPTHSSKNIIVSYQLYDQTQNNLSLEEVADLMRFFNTRTYLNVAQTYLANKDVEKALAFSLKALGLKLQLYGEKHPQTLQGFSLLGNVYLQQNNFDKALHCFEKYLGICQQLFATENSATAKAYQYLGDVYHQQQAYSQAMRYYQKAIAANLLKNSRATDDLQEAHFNPVPPQNTYDVLGLLHSLQQKAKTLEKMGKAVDASQKHLAQDHFKAALATYLACDAWIDHIRQTQSTYQDQITWAASTSLIYENAIKFGIDYYQQQPNEQVRQQLFYVFEKSKSAALLAGVMSQEALQVAALPAAVLEEENTLKANIATHQDNIRYAEWQNDRELLSLYQSYLAQNKAEYANFIQKIERQYPEYYELKFRNPTATIQELQAALPTHTTLLNYHVSNQKIYVFQIEKTHCSFHTLTTAYDIREQIQALRQSLAAPTGNHSEADMSYLAAYQQEQEQTYTNLASELYQVLIQPLDLKQAKRLLIIPHDVLTYLPFELLLQQAPEHNYQFGNHAYLLRSYAIAYAYSATIWTQMQEKTTSLPQTGKPLLAIAPDFSTDKPFQEKGDWQNTYFNALNFTQSEAEQICEQFNGDCLLDESANKDNFVELAPKYRFLHIATHAKANDKHPNRSYIVFGSKTAKEELDLLYASDIYLLRLHAELIVLGACETGTGKLQKGEGIASLSRAFAYAGSKSLCTTLWSVNDETNAIIIQEFYRFMQQGLPKDIALQQAKLHYLDRMPNDFAHPFFWAAYTLIGNISAVDLSYISTQKAKSSWWSWLLFWRK